MSFIAKQDYFGLGETGVLVVSDSSDGNSAQTATAMCEDGSIVANEVFGELLAPSNTYKIAGTVSNKNIVLGGISTVDTNKKIMLGNVSINTSAGGEPSFTASGEQVESSAADGCTYTVTLSGLNQKRHAQTLFEAFTLSGTGCYLTEANYTISANIGKATVNGVPVASDVTEGQIECSVTITQTGNTAPTLTAGTGWTITSPLSLTNPDANYPTYSATLIKYLAKDVANSQTSES